MYYCYGTPNQFEVRGLFDETGEGTVSLPIHTLKCSGMVVEWVTNKLYIVDMGNGLDTGALHSSLYTLHITYDYVFW